MLKQIEIKTDLCVIGGGLSGVFAAIAAARQGIRVVLMQERPVLGGNASSEVRMWIRGAGGENQETGIMEEFFLRNYYYNPTKNPYIFDHLLLEMVMAEKNITLLLNCTCNQAETEEGKFTYGRTIRITSISGYQMTTQRFYKVKAALFADCSGDSILAPLTGAQFRVGREAASEFGESTAREVADKLTMGNSCMIQVRETERKVPFVAPETATDFTDDNFNHRNPRLFSESENFWYLELGGDRDTIEDSEEIAEELKAMAFGTWKYLKNTPKYNADNFELDFVGALPGKRESRRYVGEYTMKQQDLSEAVMFEDTVAYGGWPMDDHFPGGFYHKGEPNINYRTDGPYPIPYRILYSKNVDNLFFAGRNVSATHMALSSIRVMGTCGVMGEAVGTAAAIAVQKGLSPHDVYLYEMKAVQEILMNNDCFLPYKKREISKLCIKTPILGGDDTLKNGEDRKNRIYGALPCGVMVNNGTPLSYQLEKPESVKAVHIVFDSDLERVTMPGGWCERTCITRCNTLLNSPDVYMPKTLCKDFILTVTCEDGNRECKKIQNNKLRAYHFEIGKVVVAIELIPISNWGNTETTNIISFDF